MAVREPTQRELNRAEELYDMLADAPDGMLSSEIEATAGWTLNERLKAAQTLRDWLAMEDDTITLTCDPDPYIPLGPWRYRLIGGNGVIDPEQSRWMINRLGDMERRLATIKHVIDVAAKTLDGRSIEGRKARIYRMHIGRAEEEIAMLNDGQVP